MRSGSAASGGAGTATTSRPARPVGADRSTRAYVYGIIPGDVELDGGLLGVGDPPGQVTMVRHGDIAALVSEVSAEWSLGSPRDLTVHKQILDSCASAAPVLPLRFGSMLENTDLVAEHLLAANHDQFAEALGELEGRVQYVVKGRYQEDAILREVLAENREAARLRDRLRAAGTGPGADRMGQARLRLGEIVGRAIEAKREQDTRMLVSQLAWHSEASVIRPPQHERDAVHIAALVRAKDASALQEAVGDQAARWRDRVDLRLLGPMAAYDFVVTTAASRS